MPRPAAALLLFLGRAAGHRAPLAGAFLEEAAEEAFPPGRAVLPPLLVAAASTAAFAPRPARHARPARPEAGPWARTQSLFYQKAHDGYASDDDDGEPENFFFFPPPVMYLEQPPPARAVSSADVPVAGGVDEGALSLEAILESEESMAMVDAIPLVDSHGQKIIPLPADWARKFHRGTVAYFEVDYLPGIDQLVRGRLVGANQEVAIERWRAADTATARHFRISDMLSDCPFVPKTFERRKFKDWTFALVEPPTHNNLAVLIAKHKAERESEWEPVVPLSKALPLMIDILAGFQELNARGVVMAEFNPNTLTISDDGTHVLIGDFRYACMEFSNDPEVSCAAAAEDFATSAYSLAPEIAGDLANRVSNNQWQLGLLFAQLLLGVDPIESLVDRLLGEVNAFSKEGRILISIAIRRYLYVWELPGFSKLAIEYADVLGILSGLLEKDPTMRLTAEDALREAMDIADSRGIPVDVRRRVPQALPREWYSE